ncbi:glycosyltransferase family 20-domain-containing protein, partial [Elsinoe ampelina]
MDSVLATSVSEDNLKSLSSTDLKSQAKTANLKVHNKKHDRKGSFGHAPPNVPDPEVSTFEDHKWTVCEPVLTNAALVNALTESPEGKKQMSHTLWIGTLSRVESDRITKDRKDEISLKFEQDHNCSIMYISDKDFQLYYEHFCKLVLWPVLNYRMPDYPKSQIYQETSWVHFERINHAFADKIISRYKSGDVIWIHDYHLMAVPGFIRDKFPDAKIGFFMHTSFPSPEVFRCVPAHAELLRGMLGANVVIFQTQEYADHFLLCCNRFLCVDNYKDGVYFKGRFVNVAVEPMRFTRQRIDAEVTKRGSRVEELVETITDVTEDHYLIFSRDKLDNIRGIRHKLLSFEMFLDRNPSMKSKATFIQFATSTTELVEIQASVIDVVNRINRRYNTGSIPSVSVLLQDIPLDHYIALLAHGDVMMVTTLREGMGLTPQEFIYCQDGSLNPQKKHGVLILSENTGTSQLLQGSDLTCNPYDIPGNARLIEKAYLMSAQEKETRYNKMRSSILRSSGGQWLLEINHKLDAAYAEQSARYHFRLPRLNTDSLTESYSSATTKLFILDNEDTLSTFPPSGLNYDDLCNTLTILTTSPHNTVYITSSLEPGTLATFYRKIPSLGLIAADGSYVRHPYSPPDQWEAAETTQTVSKWKSDIEQVLTYHLSRVEGAFAIEDMCRIVVDYTDAKHPVSARLNISELCSFINTICPGLGIRATYAIESPDHNPDGKEHTPKKQLIIGTFQTNKLSAIEKICADDAWEKCPYDWILVAGDGREDEPVMQWANQLEE